MRVLHRFVLPAGLAPAPDAAAPRAEDFDFDAAISAHRDRKVRLRQAIAERGSLDGDAARR